MTFHAHLVLPQPGTPLMVFRVHLDGLDCHLGLVQGHLVDGRPVVSALGRQCMLRLRTLGRAAHAQSQMVAVAVDGQASLVEQLRRSLGAFETGDTLLLLCPDASRYSRALRELQGGLPARRALLSPAPQRATRAEPAGQGLPPVLHDVWAAPGDACPPVVADGPGASRPFMTLAFA